MTTTMTKKGDGNDDEDFDTNDYNIINKESTQSLLPIQI